MTNRNTLFYYFWNMNIWTQWKEGLRASEQCTMGEGGGAHWLSWGSFCPIVTMICKRRWICVELNGMHLPQDSNMFYSTFWVTYNRPFFGGALWVGVESNSPFRQHRLSRNWVHSPWSRSWVGWRKYHTSLSQNWVVVPQKWVRVCRRKNWVEYNPQQ